MLRIALLFLVLLSGTVSAATAGTARRTPVALRSHRLARGHHTHVYKNYAYHSRERQKLVSFARITHPRPSLAHHTATPHRPVQPTHTTSRHTTGIF